MGTTGFYNHAKHSIGTKQISLVADDIRVLLVGSSYVFSPLHLMVSDVVAHEQVGTGYVRKVLTSKALTEDSLNFRVAFTADDLTWLGANFGAPPGTGIPDAAIVYLEGVSASDANRSLICSVNLNPKVAAAGVDFTVSWGPNGIALLV